MFLCQLYGCTFIITRKFIDCTNKTFLCFCPFVIASENLTSPILSLLKNNQRFGADPATSLIQSRNQICTLSYFRIHISKSRADSCLYSPSLESIFPSAPTHAIRDHGKGGHSTLLEIYVERFKGIR